MDLQRLRYFVAVAEKLNVSAAARSLGIRQPPLSLQIQKLEREIGGSLFSRENRRLRLTSLGAILYEDSQALLRRADELEERIRDRAAGRAGTIRILHTQAAYSEYITKRIRKFMRKRRGVRLDLRFVVNPPFVEQEPNGEWDLLLAAVIQPPKGAVIIERAPIKLALSPKHRLAARAEIVPEELLGEKLILSPLGLQSPAEEYVMYQLEQKAVSMYVHRDLAGFSERLWHAALGNGIAVCSGTDRGTHDAVCIPLAEAPELQTVAIVGSTAHPAGAELLEALRA